ncbi:hypothetical protein HPP92_000471 [Vanilla planifolia]|uniref:NAC domain-containing protein n=1 Tax=Vanilla planifolia TaxID=51239 RepID=A0A835S2X2_VANPL|nr:hypothetical protein HPP92_000471 [Vanilla planifolia]
MESHGVLMSKHLPPGFRFHPTDQELISCYLNKKVTASLPAEWDIIADVDLYKFNPWDLPEKAFFGEDEWFFFSPRDRKYPNGVRPNRAAASGYWKATGTDKPILAAGGTQCIGVKKALVFYKGRPPKGVKTEWVMHEYRLLDSVAAASQTQKPLGSMRLDDWVLCRVRQKGTFPAVSDEVTDTFSSPPSSFTLGAVSEEKHKVDMEGSNVTEWGDHQNLAYLLESHETGQSTGEASDPGFTFFTRNPYLGIVDGEIGYTEVLQWPSPLTPAALGSMKRKQPFGVFDELMFLQTGKRQQCSADGLLFATESISVNQVFPEFFI